MVNGREIEFKMNTGADVNVLSLNAAKLINASVRPSAVKLLNFEGSKMGISGETMAVCEIHGRKHEIVFVVVSFQAPWVIGLPFIKQQIWFVKEIARWRYRNLS